MRFIISLRNNFPGKIICVRRTKSPAEKVHLRRGIFSNNWSEITGIPPLIPSSLPLKNRILAKEMGEFPYKYLKYCVVHAKKCASHLKIATFLFFAVNSYNLYIVIDTIQIGSPNRFDLDSPHRFFRVLIMLFLRNEQLDDGNPTILLRKTNEFKINQFLLGLLPMRYPEIERII